MSFSLNNISIKGNLSLHDIYFVFIFFTYFLVYRKNQEYIIFFIERLKNICSTIKVLIIYIYNIFKKNNYKFKKVLLEVIYYLWKI